MPQRRRDDKVCDPQEGTPKGPQATSCRSPRNPADGEEGPSGHEQSAWMILHCAQMKAGGDAQVSIDASSGLAGGLVGGKGFSSCIISVFKGGYRRACRFNETPMTSSRGQEPPGLWPSPITAKDLSTALRFSDVLGDSDGETLVWREERSDHGVLVCHSAADASTRDLNTELSVRARVGYGGGDFTVARGCAYFVTDGRLFRQNLDQTQATPITPEAGGQCASPAVSPDGQYVLYIHSHEGTDVLALVDTAGESVPKTLVQGHDFFMQPCWHPQGNQVAWIAWDHPSMPWDSTALFWGT